jgi:hypothetical protein
MKHYEKKKEGTCKEMGKMYSFIFYGLYLKKLSMAQTI